MAESPLDARPWSSDAPEAARSRCAGPCCLSLRPRAAAAAAAGYGASAVRGGVRPRTNAAVVHHHPLKRLPLRGPEDLHSTQNLERSRRGVLENMMRCR